MRRPASWCRPSRRCGPAAAISAKACARWWAAVLGLLAEGRSNKDIAEQMGTSVRTVETHRLHLRRKLRIDGQAAPAKYAVAHADVCCRHAPSDVAEFPAAARSVSFRCHGVGVTSRQLCMTVTTAPGHDSALQAVVASLSPAVRDGTGPLVRLMRGGGLHCVFQPLADLREGNVYAHEALIRGPAGTPLHTPDRLLEAALAEGVLQEFELLCVAIALRQWGASGGAGRLFVNISADALVRGVSLCRGMTLAGAARAAGVSAENVVLEITSTSV